MFQEDACLTSSKPEVIFREIKEHGISETSSEDWFVPFESLLLRLMVDM
jgi:hypothetical protein